MAMWKVFCLMVVSVDVTTAYQSLDGSGNNVDHADWGSVGTNFGFVTAPPAYADGVQAPSNPSGPNERNVSLKLFSLPFEWNRRGINDLLPYWGQFICHDIAMYNTNASEPFDIAVERCDSYFDRGCMGNKTIKMNRNEGRIGPGGHRVVINRQTTWIDASVIYGVSESRLDWLRTRSGGRLKTTYGPKGELLPLNVDALDNDGGTNRTDLFVAGDRRANSNLLILSLQTLMHLEHNRRAGELATRHPTWDDEKLFQESRRFIIGLQQKITFKEYLPKLLGKPLPVYTGYNSSIEPMIDVNFIGTAFRYGHSSVNKWVYRYRDDGFPSIHGPLEVGDTIMNPKEIRDNGLDDVIRGAAVLPESEADVSLVEGIRNNQYLMDLGAVDIARSRERGITNYNALREALGMPRRTSFAEINPDPIISGILQDLYGDVDAVDALIGGLADRPPGTRGIISPMFNELVFRQFQNLRDSDRFYYENADEYDEELRNEISGRLLSDMIVDHTNISFYQADAFSVVPVKRRSGTSSSDLGLSFSPFDDYTMHWALRDGTFWDVQLSLTGATSTNAWVAVGFGTQMKGSDFVMCYFDAEEKPRVQDWWFGPDVQFPTPDVLQGRTDDIIPDSIHGEFVNGILTFQFTRKLITSDPLDAKIPMGAASMLFAYSTVGSPNREPEYHGPANRKVAIVNLESGSSAETQGSILGRPLAALYVTHGIVMMIAWLVVIPASVVVTRYMPMIRGQIPKNAQEKNLQWQSRVALHRILAQSGIAAVIAVAAAVLLSGGGGYVFFRHTHSILGIIILCVLTITTALGACISSLEQGDDDDYDDEEVDTNASSNMALDTLKKVHKACGVVLCGLGFWNVYHGMMLLWERSPNASAFYTVWVAMLMGFFAYHEGGLRFAPKEAIAAPAGNKAKSNVVETDSKL